ncbi:MAG: Eco57I restriction-modification methylase domain-containing protein [Anaerolineales bacterium]|nr:MAG: Eco57I restriction-modification methylase domain-containing protein [Anaerolineales bacterium]
MLSNVTFNPDVLSCLANLSNDEVFTPPQLANQMLDLLPVEIWQDKNATFLDPACKTGVFLREAAKRLDAGLQQQIPDRQARINHIFTKQLFGIPVTELTALMSRRSLYCSKYADGKYSVTDGFADEQGNIRYERVEHTWQNGRCTYCGASEEEYARGEALETHAYRFIHTSNPEEIFDMKFDVIIGNPPYQLSDGGFGRSASPIYQKFVEQAQKLQPRFLTMIIPARWFGGGKGLDEFRRTMLNDQRLKKIVDFEDSSEIFPGVSVAGGICYFLWDRDNTGPCEVINVHSGAQTVSKRRLNEFDIFIRQSQAVPIVRKVLAREERRMNEQVSAYKPFGLRTYEKPQKTGDIILFWQKGEGPYKRKDITTGIEMIDKWKVVASRSGHEHAGNPGNDGARRVLARTAILPPGTVCTETYLVIGSYSTKKEAKNLLLYMKTRFFRFFMSLFMYSHGITKETFSYIPVLNMNQQWSDQKLFERYEFTKSDVDFIEAKIRPME